MAFDAVEPIGDRRLDLLFAVLQQTVIASQHGSEKAPSVGDLLPDWASVWAKLAGSKAQGGGDGG